MKRKRSKDYPYLLGDPLLKSRKKSPWASLFKGLLLLGILGGGIYLLWSFHPFIPSQLASRLPLPRQLLSIEMLHNGEKTILRPREDRIFNPVDTLGLLKVNTDGWISRGVQVASREIDLEPVRDRSLPLDKLLPGESFEHPKTVTLEAYWWGRFLGRVSFTVRLNARDWLRKALATSDTSRKIHCLQKALELEPRNILVRTQLANLYLATQRYEKAIEAYLEILEAGKSRDIMKRLLMAYQLGNQVGKALEIYTELLAVSRDPEDFKRFLQYFQQHRSKEDLEEYVEKNRDRLPESFSNSLLLMAAEKYVEEKEWKRAAVAYEKALKSGAQAANIHYNLAVAYEKDGRRDKAVEAMKTYLEKEPEDTEALLRLGILQEETGRLQEARKVYEALLKSHSDKYAVLLRLADLLDKTGDRKGLIEVYEQLAKSNPGDLTIRFNLGVLYYEAGNREQSARIFEALAREDETDAQSRRYLLDIYEKQNNVQAMERTLLSLARASPGNMEYYGALFSLYDRAGNYSAIVSFFDKVTERYPNSVSLRKYVLYGALKKGDDKKAIEELEHLARIQPQEKKYLRQAARLYEDRKNYEQALKKLDQLLKIDPDDKEAEDDYLRLKQLVL